CNNFPWPEILPNHPLIKGGDPQRVFVGKMGSLSSPNPLLKKGGDPKRGFVGTMGTLSSLNPPLKKGGDPKGGGIYIDAAQAAKTKAERVAFLFERCQKLMSLLPAGSRGKARKAGKTPRQGENR
ncbi:MAG: hypothetical protein ABFE02_00220, partial [Sulfuricella sp.]